MKKILPTIALAVMTSSAAAVTFVSVVGEIAMTTSPDRRSAVVIVTNGGVGVAQFCLTFPEPLKEAISVVQKGQVIFLPQPLEGLPPGEPISGPEPIAQTLTVVPASGGAMAFVAKGVKPIYSEARVFEIRSVSRQDWEGPNETRHVPGKEACFGEGSKGNRE